MSGSESTKDDVVAASWFIRNIEHFTEEQLLRSQEFKTDKCVWHLEAKCCLNQEGIQIAVRLCRDKSALSEDVKIRSRLCLHRSGFDDESLLYTGTFSTNESHELGEFIVTPLENNTTQTGYTNMEYFLLVCTIHIDKNNRPTCSYFVNDDVKVLETIVDCESVSFWWNLDHSSYINEATTFVKEVEPFKLKMPVGTDSFENDQGSEIEIHLQNCNSNCFLHCQIVKLDKTTEQPVIKTVANKGFFFTPQSPTWKLMVPDLKILIPSDETTKFDSLRIFFSTKRGLVKEDVSIQRHIICDYDDRSDGSDDDDSDSDDSVSSDSDGDDSDGDDSVTTSASDSSDEGDSKGSTIKLCEKNTNPKLEKKIKSLYICNSFNDCNLCTGDKEFPATRTVLYCSSDVFERMFQSNMMEGNTRRAQIQDIESKTLMNLLHFAYCEELLLLPEEFEDTLKLYEASNEYHMMQLQNTCRRRLEAAISENNSCKLLFVADLCSDEELTKFVENYLLRHTGVFSTDDWRNLIHRRPLLTSLIMQRAFSPPEIPGQPEERVEIGAQEQEQGVPEDSDHLEREKQEEKKMDKSEDEEDGEQKDGEEPEVNVTAQNGSNNNEENVESSDQSLVSQLRRFFVQERFIDCHLLVENKILKAHCVVLCSHSVIFTALVKSCNQSNDVKEIIIPEIFKVPVMKCMIDFMYFDAVGDMTWDVALELYAASLYFRVDSLKKSCLINFKSHLNINNILLLLVFAHNHGDEDLKKLSEDFVRSNQLDLFASVLWGTFIENNPLLASRIMFKYTLKQKSEDKMKLLKIIKQRTDMQ